MEWEESKYDLEGPSGQGAHTTRQANACNNSLVLGNHKLYSWEYDSPKHTSLSSCNILAERTGHNLPKLDLYEKPRISQLAVKVALGHTNYDIEHGYS